MENNSFKAIRTKLNKTQKELAQLLGVSIKAIHSYEQGWRRIPHHVERQLLFLLSRILLKDGKSTDKCWNIRECPDQLHKTCPAREFQAEDMCWFINGTRCSGKVHESWEEKMNECRECEVFKGFFEPHKDKKKNE